MPAKKTTKKKVAKKTSKVAKKASKAAKKTAKPAVKQAKKAKKKSTTKKTKKIEEKKKSKIKKSKVKKSKAIEQPAEVKIKLSPFVKKQRQRLMDLRDEMISAVQGISQMARESTSNMSSGSGEHTGDAGSDAYDRDYALGILAKEQDALYEIERALHRIEIGQYGICQMSGEPIPNVRLEVLPFCRLTVECQTLWESKNGKRRYNIREGAKFTNLNLKK